MVVAEPFNGVNVQVPERSTTLSGAAFAPGNRIAKVVTIIRKIKGKRHFRQA